MKKHLATLSRNLSESTVDAIFITSPSAIIHLTSFHGFSPNERDAYILITKQAAYLFTNALYITPARRDIHHMTVHEISLSNSLPDQLKKLQMKHNIKRLGIETDNLTIAEWHILRPLFTELSHFSPTGLRAVKSDEEIGKISHACVIADRALKKIREKIKPGMTEKDLVFFLEMEIRKAGFDIAFPTIVAFGQNAASPHHLSGHTTLKVQDTILIDFGARVDGYNSDMTRTFFMGKPDERMKRIYDAVLLSQQKAADYLTDILTGKSSKRPQAAAVDRVARSYLLKRGFPTIPHSLGHGIGLEVHEAPHISPGSQELLENGMVFSLEPGVYYPGDIGVRIEDLYTIRNGNLAQLTKFPSNLTVL